MFERDIVAWGLHEKDGMVCEVHLLKGGHYWVGPWLRRKEWERAQRQMRKPYPERLRKPVDVIVDELERASTKWVTGRLAI